MSGPPSVTSKGSLISINSVVLLLPKAVQKGIFYFDRFLLTAVNIYLLILSVKFTMNAATKMSPLMRIPYSYIDACLVVMFTFIVLFSFRDLIRAILKLDDMETERRAE
jgi:TRAP-type C4-dicarboxylate transport system permease small subunit